MPVDVDLDSPLIPLAGLYLVGQNSRGRRYTGGESGRGMLAAGFADASADYVTGEILGATGLDGTVTNSLGRAMLGAGVSRWGGAIPQNRAMTRGIMYGVMSDSISELGVDLGSLFGDLGGAQTATTQTQTVQKTQPKTSTDQYSSSGNKVRF